MVRSCSRAISIRPPWARTISSTIASPSPTEPWLPANRSNGRSSAKPGAFVAHLHDDLRAARRPAPRRRRRRAAVRCSTRLDTTRPSRSASPATRTDRSPLTDDRRGTPRRRSPGSVVRRRRRARRGRPPRSAAGADRRPRRRAPAGPRSGRSADVPPPRPSAGRRSSSSGDRGPESASSTSVSSSAKRSAQLVAGVRDEPPLAVEALVQPVEHGVQRHARACAARRRAGPAAARRRCATRWSPPGRASARRGAARTRRRGSRAAPASARATGPLISSWRSHRRDGLVGVLASRRRGRTTWSSIVLTRTITGSLSISGFSVRLRRGRRARGCGSREYPSRSSSGSTSALDDRGRGRQDRLRRRTRPGRGCRRRAAPPPQPRRPAA